MRYIDPEPVGQNLPPGWAESALQAEAAVANVQPQARSAEVKKHSTVWQGLKENLKNVSHNKCWYCESIDVRSDNAVDHFRPKNAVAECPDHEGYWWLAIKWENYPHKRATTSIKLYHLNHRNVVEQRKALCYEIHRRVKDADRYFDKYDTGDGDGTAQQAFEDAVRDIRGRLAATAPYSAAARAMLMGLRGTHPVVEVVLASA